MMNFNWCVLVMFFLDLNTVRTLNRKFLSTEFIEADDYQASDNIHTPKGLIIFIVDAGHRNDQLRNKIGKYSVDPYNFLKGSPGDGVKTKKTKENMVKDLSMDFSREILNGLKLTRQQSELLRRSWSSSCDRKAAKLCKIACRISYKNVCKTFRCAKNMKRRFKWECSRNCKIKFKG